MHGFVFGRGTRGSAVIALSSAAANDESMKLATRIEPVPHRRIVGIFNMVYAPEE